MIELTGMGSVSRAIGWLYWLLAISAISFAVVKGKTLRTKALWTTIAVVVFGFLPGKAMVEQYRRDTYAKEAWVYFKKKCDTEAGEKIYKTYTGVKSVFVVKPLPPATEKDLYDQFWYGDPYSNSTPWDRRGEQKVGTLIGQQRFISGRGEIGFEFFEQEITASDGKTFQRVEPSQVPPYFVSKSSIDKPASRFGVSWEDISTSDDRRFWVAGSRFRVIDLIDNSIVAERIGFFIEAGFGSTAGQRRPWLTSRGPGTTCPSLSNGTFEDRWFILKTLNPDAGVINGK
jgi:hypothetical protein